MSLKSGYKFWFRGVLILPLISGILMLLAWPTIGMFPLLFFGLVPLFFAFDDIQKINGKLKYAALLVASFIAHFSWIAFSLKWLSFTSPQSYLTAVIIESFSLSLATLPVLWATTKFGNTGRFVFFAAAWMSVEFLNQFWLLGTPYFALGNGFGMYPRLIQHYEYIGIEGGTLWLLISNFLIYLLIQKLISKSTIIRQSIFTSAFIVLPLLFSCMIYATDTSGNRKAKVTVVQTFFEPGLQKYSDQPEIPVDKLLKYTEPAFSNRSELVLWPETIINNLGWLMNISQEKAFVKMYKRLEKSPGTTICTGGYGYSVAKEDTVSDPYARYMKHVNLYYKTHNIALTVTFGGRSPIRSKEYFVPFQERIPFLKEMPFMANFADVVGANTMISHYPKGEEVHKTSTGISFTPVLCYESIYPVRIAEKASKVQLIAILANEFWNKDLSGSGQYLYNNVGMAIQSRVPIAKSSNSGMSAIIDLRGNILGTRKGSNIGLLTREVELGDAEPTFYGMISGAFYWIGVIVFIPAFIWFLTYCVGRAFRKKQ